MYLDNRKNPIELQGHRWRSSSRDQIFGYFIIAR